MKKSICRGCAHQKGWLPPPQRRTTIWPSTPCANAPRRQASKQGYQSGQGALFGDLHGARGAPNKEGSHTNASASSETGRNQTSSFTPANSRCRSLDRSHRHKVGAIEGSQCSRCEGACASTDGGYDPPQAHKSLAEAEEALKQRHIEEEKALQEEEAAPSESDGHAHCPGHPHHYPSHHGPPPCIRSWRWLPRSPAWNPLHLARSWQKGRKRRNAGSSSDTCSSPTPHATGQSTYPDRLHPRSGRCWSTRQHGITPARTTTWTTRPHALVPRAGPAPHSLVPRLGGQEAVYLTACLS